MFFSWRLPKNTASRKRCLRGPRTACLRSRGGVFRGGTRLHRWRPEQEESLTFSFLNLRFFGKKCTVLKKVLVTFLELLRCLLMSYLFGLETKSQWLKMHSVESPWECDCNKSRGTSVSFLCRNSSTLTAV